MRKVTRLQLATPDLLKRGVSLINGRWMPATSGRAFAVHDPAAIRPSTGPTTATAIAEVPDMNADDVEHAIAAAHHTFTEWTTPGHAHGHGHAHERSRMLRRWYDLIMTHRQDLANIVTAENGKPYKEALGEVQYGASFVEWFAEEAKRMYGDVIPAPVGGRRLLAMRQPVGVCALITPWNFPVAMITRKMAPALAAGCTVVLKPAHDTPLSALALAHLAQEAGFPAGAINVVTCAHSNTPAIGQILTTDKRIRKVSVTGSTAVGKWIAERASGSTLKRLSLELGGNAPFIVFPPQHEHGRSAYIDRAVKGLIAAKFRNSGQTCVSPNRIFLHDSVHDEFVARLKVAVQAMPVGNGYEEGTLLGPLISAAAKDKVRRHVEDALGKGATLVNGNVATPHPPTSDDPHSPTSDNLFFPPTILTDCTPHMLFAQEETFGPIVPIFRFHSRAEVLQLANDTDVGLAAYFFTQDLAEAWYIAERLDVGMVGVNEGMISTEVAPFGGVKESGYGREGSRYGLDEYTNIKYVCMGGLH